MAADAAKSSAYWVEPEALTIEPDEIGDAPFSLLLVAHDVDVDAEVAIERALETYERRLDETGRAGSGGYRTTSATGIGQRLVPTESNTDGIG